MFSKHVWHDRKHQAEVYATQDGVLSGTLVAYEGAVCAVNPRPEVLLALYQEAKIKKILAVKAVILTNDSIEFTRGLCAFVNYCRGLRRRSPLAIISRAGTAVTGDFLNSCCSRLWGDSEFDLSFTQLGAGDSIEVGKGTVSFQAADGDAAPYLAISTEKGRLLHYYDESHRGSVHDETADTVRPNVVIRAAQVPGYLQYTRQIFEGVGKV